MPQIVLVEPQIPPNTGNISRTCAATSTPLHLIEPLGFSIDDRHLKRAGLDYWSYVDLTVHASWSDFIQTRPSRSGRLLGFTTQGEANYSTFEYRADDWLIFGRETSGLDPEMLAACDTTLYIPMAQPGVRSLNLSVSVAIGLFEALRQTQQLTRKPRTPATESITTPTAG